MRLQEHYGPGRKHLVQAIVEAAGREFEPVVRGGWAVGGWCISVAFPLLGCCHTSGAGHNEGEGGRGHRTLSPTGSEEVGNEAACPLSFLAFQEIPKRGAQGGGSGAVHHGAATSPHPPNTHTPQRQHHNEVAQGGSAPSTHSPPPTCPRALSSFSSIVSYPLGARAGRRVSGAPAAAHDQLQAAGPAPPPPAAAAVAAVAGGGSGSSEGSSGRPMDLSGSSRQ